MIETWCSECKKPCEVELVDDGIGPYEFWGMKGVDRRMVAVSDCCEADPVHEDGRPLSDSEVWGLCEPPEREYEPEYD
jgi:hypothetical protein